MPTISLCGCKAFSVRALNRGYPMYFWPDRPACRLDPQPHRHGQREFYGVYINCSYAATNFTLTVRLIADNAQAG